MNNKKENKKEKLVSALTLKEKRSAERERLEKKGVIVGEGYNIKKLKRAYLAQEAKKIPGRIVDTLAKKKVISRRIIRSQRMTVVQSTRKPEPYKSIYFNPESKEVNAIHSEIKKERDNLFFN